jgi:serine/threonine-protein phosphatase 6 catalytic subunit
MKALCSRVRDLLLEESNVHLVQSPVTVCGDIHGQFWDVLEIFRQGGEVPGSSYIFMVSDLQLPALSPSEEWTERS